MATGCGYVVVELDAKTKKEAVEELIELIKEEYSNEEIRLSEAKLFEINSGEEIGPKKYQQGMVFRCDIDGTNVECLGNIHIL